MITHNFHDVYVYVYVDVWHMIAVNMPGMIVYKSSFDSLCLQVEPAPLFSVTNLDLLSRSIKRMVQGNRITTM